MEKILLITTKEQTRKEVRSALSEAEFDILSVDNEEVAINMVSNTEEPFDMVLVDEKLFFLDGVGFVIFMRKVLKNKSMPVILLMDEVDCSDICDLYDSGVVDFIRRPIAPQELLARIRGAQNTRNYIEEITRLANYDELTGLFNRRTFFNILGSRFNEAVRYKKNMSLCMIDVDNFKSINDNYGHTAGDMVLSSIATSMLSRIRTSDVAGRYGGEEFILLFPETVSKRAYVAAERIRRQIEKLEFDYLNGEHVTLSIGIAQFEEFIHKSFEDLIREADRALYAAKDAGKNRVACSDEID